MKATKIEQYPNIEHVTTPLDKLDDALDLISLLSVTEVVTKLLTQEHNKSSNKAKTLSKRISHHARTAEQYARASLLVEAEISFLPAYYAVLNLMKIISLCGPYDDEFDRHSRWHGARYDFRSKNSQSLLTDVVQVKRGGALALYYKTLTGEEITSDVNISMRAAYEGIVPISAELSYITGTQNGSVIVDIFSEHSKNPAVVEARVSQLGSTWGPYQGNVRSLPFLIGYKKKPKVPGVFRTTVTPFAGMSPNQIASSTLNFAYLHSWPEKNVWLGRLKTGSLGLPEEFCISLAFFHLSSVCRYNPEFLSRIRNGQHWPLLLTLRRHGLYHFLIASYSAVIRREYRAFGS